MSSKPPATSIDGPVAVIGDVHGQAEQLRQIIRKLERTPDIQHRWIVFIGDLVDRGPDSKGVLDLYCDLSRQHDKVTSICGNHDLAMAASLGLIETPPYIDWETNWLQMYSADTTFNSYGIQLPDISALREALPEEHAALLSSLPWRVEHPFYLFVHAGLDPVLPFDLQLQILRQPDYSLGQPSWLFSKTFIRGPVPHECPVTVVQGHVPLREVYFGDQIIGTDTTGGVEGDLSCVLLPENIVLTSAEELPPHQWS